MPQAPHSTPSHTPPLVEQPHSGIALRRSKQRRHANVPFAINIAPMIDVTFLLLIFFVITTTFTRPEGMLASKLPTDRGVPAVALPFSPILIRINQAGPNAADFEIRIDNFENQLQTFDELATFLTQLQQRPGFDEDTPIIIRADDEVAWDHVVNGWNAAVRCSYNNIAFSGS